MIPHRFTTKERESFYAEAVQRAIADGRGPHPFCNICDQTIFPPSRWHVSHNPHLPRALGGNVTGIAHDRCNLKHAWRFDMTIIAKNKRMALKHRDIYRTAQPMQGGRDDRLKKKCNGDVVMRATGERSS